MKVSEMKKDARRALKGKWGKAICIILAFELISFIIGFIQNFFEESSLLYKIIDLAYLVTSIPLSFGLLISFIKLKRGEEISAFGFLKEGFSKFGEAWEICLRTLLKLLLPIICLSITSLPFILLLAFLVYYIFIGIWVNLSSTVNISLEPVYEPILKSINSIPNFEYILPIMLILLILSIVYVIRKSLLYVMAYNINFDNPDLSSKECVNKSAELMKGNRGKYFLLVLSFIGWGILALFTFGIGYLWLAPYMQVTTICFYEKLIKPKTENSEEVINTKE